MSRLKRICRLVLMLSLVVLIASGCLLERGDWQYELKDGYTIIRVNAHGIELARYNPDWDGYENILNHYYITDFCMNEAYIGVRGIPTADIWATDEELQSSNRVYYLVDISNGNCYGPDSKLEFYNHCEQLSTGDLGDWQSTNH